MRVLILGGDGFCGWPTALHLREVGHDITILDNGQRRMIAKFLGAPSLTPIATQTEREKKTGIPIYWVNVVNNPQTLVDFVEQTDCVVHFAEQRSAPFSMKCPMMRAATVQRNMVAAVNVCNALLEYPHVHLVHLGTAGVYGYSGASGKTPEGWVDWHGERRLYPFKPGSVYHATKCMESILYEFYCRNDRLKITDLHQGIVWGTQTDETSGDERLINRFDYDGDFGTVLNRFLVQAVVDDPITVYGSGGQTRAFIHIRDTVKCIRLAVENPPEAGEYRILNQSAECLRIMDLAEKVLKLVGRGKIECIPNPRKEADRNELDLENTKLKALGWDPLLLDNILLDEIVQIVEKYKDNIKLDCIAPTSRW